MNLDIQKVAEFILATMREQGDYVSHLKLQKLTYYAQAWFLALYDEALFEDDCEAWVHGPVYPALYERFQPYRMNLKPILEIPPDNVRAESIDLPTNVKEHLAEIINVFGNETAHALEQMTHQEQPWLNARNGLREDEPSTAVITKEDMRIYYKQLSEATTA